MEKLKEIWTEHKKTILIVAGLIVAFVVYRKSTANATKKK